MNEGQPKEISGMQHAGIAAPAVFIALITLLSRPEYLSFFNLFFLGITLWYTTRVIVLYYIKAPMFFHISTLHHPKDRVLRVFLVVLAQVLSVWMLVGFWLRLFDVG